MTDKTKKLDKNDGQNEKKKKLFLRPLLDRGQKSPFFLSDSPQLRSPCRLRVDVMENWVRKMEDCFIKHIVYRKYLI